MSILGVWLITLAAAALAEAGSHAPESFGGTEGAGPGIIWYPYPSPPHTRPHWMNRVDFKRWNNILTGASAKNPSLDSDMDQKLSTVMMAIGKSSGSSDSVGAHLSEIMGVPVFETARTLSQEEAELVLKVFGKSIDPRRIVLTLSNGITMPVFNPDGSVRDTLRVAAYANPNNLGMDDIDDLNVWREIIVFERDAADWISSEPASPFKTLGSPNSNWKLKPEYLETLMHELTHAQLIQRQDPKKMLHQGKRAQRTGRTVSLRRDSFKWMNTRFVQSLMGLQKALHEDLSMVAETGSVVGSYDWRSSLKKGKPWDQWSEESQAEAIGWVAELHQGHVTDDGTLAKLEGLWKQAKIHPLKKRMPLGPDPSAPMGRSRRSGRSSR